MDGLARETLSGWGRFPRLPCRTADARGEAEVRARLAEGRSWIARGAGRSYGDPALNPDGVLRMGKSNRFLSFDPATGELACEAGVLLADVVATFAPRGWFPPVTPGTKFVTVGGMAACDVHGKNHHCAGSFGRHLLWLDVMLADGAVVRTTPGEDLFAASVGGMGLCGVILRLAFRLIPIEGRAIRQDTVAAPDLDAAMAAFEARPDATYAVAWIDCLTRGAAQGRSLVYFGEHATAEEARAAPPPRPARAKRVPVDFPALALNPLSVRAFNELYWRRGRPGRAVVDYEPYFYPLDAVLEWNRIYGPGGFVQHQCVLPPTGAREALGLMLDRISARGAGSFLAVLKLMGEGTPGCPLSFPMPGWTLALDFQATSANFSLLTELDAIVADHGGRLYLAKDARAGASSLRGYPDLDLFRELKARFDPERRFRSAQSERLGL